MGDYDYLGRVPPPRGSDTPTFSDNADVATDDSDADGDSASPVMLQMPFADGATRLVTLHPNMPNPADPNGPGGPAIVIHVTPVAAQAANLDAGLSGNSQIVTGQGAQQVPTGAQTAPSFLTDAPSILDKQPPPNFYETTNSPVKGSNVNPASGAQTYDGLCRLPDGSIYPYTNAGGGYVNIYGGGSANTNGQAGIGQAGNSTASPTMPKPGGIGGGGKSGPWTSPASNAARQVTGSARIQSLEPITGTASVGGSIARAIPFLGGAMMLDDFIAHDTAPVCEPVYDPTKVY